MVLDQGLNPKAIIVFCHDIYQNILHDNLEAWVEVKAEHSLLLL